jgi:hypothetical protein
METNEKGWQEFFMDGLDNTDLQGSIIPLILTTNDPPDELLTQVLQMLDKSYYQWVRSICSQQSVPEKHLQLLFNLDNSTVAQAAAEGEWLAEPKGVIRPSLKKDWEQAILRSKVESSIDHGYWLGEILSKEPDLSSSWLNGLISNSSDKFSSFLHRKVIRAAIQSLTHSMRLELLKRTPNEYGLDTFIIDLVEKSPEIYQSLLGTAWLQRYHLTPLSGDIDSAWVQLVTLATHAGYSVHDIANATMEEYNSVLSNMDKEADKWLEWVNRFEKVSSDVDANVRTIAKVGIELARKRLKSAQDRLRYEAVYGDL